MWLGSPDNIVNLHAFLPGSYRVSEATSAWEGDGVVYVGGWANSAITSQDEAFLWIGVPAPAAATPFLLGAGLLAVRRRRGRAVCRDCPDR